MCLVLALWKLGSDFQVAGQFVFAEGIFSRWQFWGSGAIGLQAGAWILDRYAFSNRQ
jgi:hypothetical protein